MSNTPQTIFFYIYLNNISFEKNGLKHALKLSFTYITRN